MDLKADPDMERWIGRLHGGPRMVFDALVSDGARESVAFSAIQPTPSHLSKNWRGLYVEIAAAKERAIRLDDDRRHAGKSLYWRCVMPLCRHCGAKID